MRSRERLGHVLQINRADLQTCLGKIPEPHPVTMTATPVVWTEIPKV